jgi:hypothetical protein
MKPAVIEGSTHALGAPHKWDQEANGRCTVLHVKAEVIQGIGFLRSAWEPEEADPGLLLAGARMVLGIAGSPDQNNQIAHPVVHLALTDVPEDIPPTLTARQFVQPDGSQALHVEMIFGPGKRGVATVSMNASPFHEAVALGAENITEMARLREWIA